MNRLMSVRSTFSLISPRLSLQPRPIPISRLAVAIPIRFYSAASLSKADIESRVLDILKKFDKVDQSKLSVGAHFNKDLGLDSLDTVEVLMAIEEEFSVEIPDKDADDIKSTEQAVEYISKREDAH